MILYLGPPFLPYPASLRRDPQEPAQPSKGALRFKGTRLGELPKTGSPRTARE